MVFYHKKILQINSIYLEKIRFQKINISHILPITIIKSTVLSTTLLSFFFCVLMEEQKFSRAAAPQREGLQLQLCPGLLVWPCSLLIVPVCSQLFSTASKSKETYPSDTTHTQTTPAHLKGALRTRGQHDKRHVCFSKARNMSL